MATRRNRRYTRAEKDYAKRLLTEGYTIDQIHKNTGLSKPILSSWAKGWMIKPSKRPKTDARPGEIDTLPPDQVAAAPVSAMNALALAQAKLESDISKSEDLAENIDLVMRVAVLQQCRAFLKNMPPIESYADFIRVVKLLKDDLGGDKTGPTRAADLSILLAKPIKPYDPEPTPESDHDDPEPDHDDTEPDEDE